MLKRLVILFITASLLFSACAAGQPDNASGQDAAGSGSGSLVSMDKQQNTVTVTLPAFMFGDQDSAAVVAKAKESGVSEAKRNDDGSYTYIMTSEVHRQMIEQNKADLETAIEQMKSGQYQSIKDVAYDDVFSRITLSVDREKYESGLDGMAVIALGFMGSFYQLFSGIPEADAKTLVEVSDEATGEVFSSVIYPDVLYENGDGSGK